jgi:hypothetical protein
MALDKVSLLVTAGRSMLAITPERHTTPLEEPPVSVWTATTLAAAPSVAFASDFESPISSSDMFYLPKVVLPCRSLGPKCGCQDLPVLWAPT